MTRNIINIGSYKYLIEHYNVIDDLKTNEYISEFVMLRNFTIMNNIIYDNDIYIFEKDHLNEYIEELKVNGTFGNSIAFPITDTNVNNYSDSYTRFNNNFNKDSLYNKDGLKGEDVYELKEIYTNNLGIKKIKNKKIKCNKIRIYHPMTKLNINAIIDINSVINNIKFHFLCRPFNKYKSQSETEIKYNNETYSEFIELYYPNLEELFKQNLDGTYNVYYEEEYNIVASTRNEKFINSIMSDSADIEHSEYLEGEYQSEVQIVPLNLLIQPYRIIEEYAADSDFNYNDNIEDDEKIFVKLYLKTHNSIENNYLTYPINISIYPYESIDEQNNIYILDSTLPQATVSLHNETKFSLMSRLGFSDGIISLVALFNYPNKSYFCNLYKDDTTTSPVLEAYKYYNNVSDNDYKLFVNEDIVKEIEEIDSVDSISEDMIKTVKEVANVNYVDKKEILNTWKDLMKKSIIDEYEEEFGTPGNFVGFKVDIATDYAFKNIIFSKNIRVNFNDIDDFAFKLNGIFDKWEQRPEKLIIKSSFYDHILGVEIQSNLVIITKEWFKYLINNVNVHRLTFMSQANKDKGKLDDDMKVIELKDDNINFINKISCFINKNENSANVNGINKNQRIILKPVFYKVKDLQNIILRSTLPQNIGVNLSEYMTKVDTFKMIIGNKEFVEKARNDIFVIFNINPADIEGTAGKYDITNEDGTYLSSGNWSIV